MSIHIKTSDSFFRYALDTLMQNIRLNNENDVVLIDIGSKYLLFIHFYRDVISLFLYRKVKLLSKLLICNVPLEDFYMRLLAKRTIKASSSECKLSASGLQMLYLFLNRYYVHSVAKMLKISFKTFGIHKQRGLKRLGLSNVATLSCVLHKGFYCLHPDELTQTQRYRTN